jgi:fucose permease
MFDHLDAGRKQLFFALLANFVILGISMTIFGAAVPQIIDGFGWDYLSTGMVMSAGALGGFLSTVACGILLRRIPAKLLLTLGLGLIALGLALFGRIPSALANAVINLGIGLGAGFSEVITNSAVVRMEKPGESRLMNLMHASFCVGAALGPIFVGVLGAVHLAFTVVFAGSAGLQALIILLMLLQSFPDMRTGSGASRNDEGRPADGSPVAAAKSPPWKRLLFWALVGAMFLYVGVELTYSGWIAEFSARHRFLDSSTAAFTVSAFWLGLLAGRLGLSLRYRGKRQEIVLALLASGSVLFYALTVLSPAGTGPASLWTWACALLTGLCFSGCYPIIMSVLGAEFEGSTVVLGICSSAAGAGTLLFPMATGAFASSAGLPRAMLAAAGVDALLAALSIGIALGRKRSQVIRAD